jgi:hypothetical protein
MIAISAFEKRVELTNSFLAQQMSLIENHAFEL